MLRFALLVSFVVGQAKLRRCALFQHPLLPSIEALDNLGLQVGHGDAVVATHSTVLCNQKFGAEVPAHMHCRETL